MHSRSTLVGDIRMRWEESGAGTPVVFLHGIPTSPRLWRHVLPRLEGARGLAWELVGYGASIPEGRTRDLSVAMQAEYLTAWMRALRLEPAVLVGHDLGGGVAQRVAIYHPDRVRALVLINSICDDSWPIPSVRAVALGGALARRMPPRVFAQLVRSLLVRGHETLTQAEQALAEHLPLYTRHGGAEALVRQARALDPRDTRTLEGALGRVSLPIRVVWGEDDPFQKLEHGQWLAQRLRAPLERVKRGRHFVPEDRPEPVLHAVHSVLEQVHAPPPRRPSPRAPGPPPPSPQGAGPP